MPPTGAFRVPARIQVLDRVTAPIRRIGLLDLGQQGFERKLLGLIVFL